MPHPDLGFDGGNLRTAADDSCGSLRAAGLGDLIECAAIAVERGLFARERLPPLNRHVNVFRIEFDGAADAFCEFRGRERRAAAQERVEDRIPHASCD